jgi:hypothetical protein
VVPGLENPEFDTLAAESDDTLGPNVEADGAAAHEYLQFTCDGIDAADYTIGLE